MSRAKSSSLAKIKDLATSLIVVIDSVQSEMDKLTFDSARLKEIEPALAKLQAALKPATIEPTTGETPPAKEGDLCKSCKHDEDKDFDCTHDAAESCGGFDKIAEPIKRARRIRKKLSEAGNIPPSEKT
jgi:hypothetical protein